MMMIKLHLAYDGADYNGWQTQANGVGIQSVVQDAVRLMTKEKNVLIGASRTDAGVHAVGQVAHFSTHRAIPSYGWVRGLCSILPPAITVLAARKVSADFHARRSARWKHYRYYCCVGTVCPPFCVDRVWHLAKWPALAPMAKAARVLVGTHDFSTFAAAGDGAASKTRTIYRCRVRRVSNLLAGLPGGLVQPGLVIDCIGNGFLKQMVRNIVGTLVEIGQGRIAQGDLARILRTRDRRKAGRCAPAGGLYLLKVGYGARPPMR
ncbi:MAG: tRNA pseudouridine(38-40) synthase TruA [Deltaproteobacteria bacterium]|nr:tRNA pseudouridine(38-40) synthase TruA [Deltaproteobacteria bacterium]